MREALQDIKQIGERYIIGVGGGRFKIYGCMRFVLDVEQKLKKAYKINNTPSNIDFYTQAEVALSDNDTIVELEFGELITKESVSNGETKLRACKVGIDKGITLTETDFSVSNIPYSCIAGISKRQGSYYVAKEA